MIEDCAVFQNTSNLKLVKCVRYVLETRSLITRKDVEHALNISQTMAGRVIKQLTEKDLIVLKGAGPRIMYEIKIK